MAEALEHHTLKQILDTPKFQSFYMEIPGKGRNMSQLLTFSPEGITIQGDLTPGRNGNVSCLGYGIGWFRGRLSEDYLCEKFLELGWTPELAEKDLRNRLKDISDGIETVEKPYEVEQIEQLADDCNYGDLGMESFRDSWMLISNDQEWLPGWGYNLREKGWLCAIQQRFAQLYNAQEADLVWRHSALGYAISR